MRRILRTLTLLLSVALLAAACGDDGDTTEAEGDGTTTEAPSADDGDEGDDGTDPSGTITVYSGRSEELVQPIIDRFSEETGITVEVRYGDTVEMAALILDEGSGSPADVYYGQDAGALGALSAEGRLATLSDDQLDLVPAAYRSESGDWVGTSGRARVVVYNTDALSEDDLPDSILGFTDPEWGGGRIGWAPTNGSFQAFVTALRELEGEDGAREWLEGIQANSPVVFDGNSPIVEAVAAGEVEVGFVNHYYLFRFLAENPDFAAANKYYGGGDPGGLVNVAGMGVLDSSDNADAANAFIDFMVSDDAQRYFADETYEIPLVEGISPAEGVPTFDDLTIPDLDLNRLEDLEGTLELLTDLGIV
jgi:iron(III) transport system substrate-binding protein